MAVSRSPAMALLDKDSVARIDPSLTCGGDSLTGIWIGPLKFDKVVSSTQSKVALPHVPSERTLPVARFVIC